jgi:hypothetical protein
MRSIAIMVVAALGCGGRDPGTTGDGGGDGAGGDGSYPGGGDDIDVATGCAGVYNPGQVLEFHLTMSAGDWATVQNDCTFSQYVPAELSCGDGATIQVGVRHKRSGGTMKPGLKIDINRFVAGQTFFGLKKMDWENGVGSEVGGCGNDGSSTGAMLSEYLGWWLHVQSGEKTGHAAFVNVTLNGAPLGAFLSVEEIDKSFLRRRVGDDTGWVWKFSGGQGDGQQTNEGVTDPYLAYFCFFEKNGCAIPSATQLAAELPGKLDIPQLLSVAGVNALMGNHDAIMLKLNNFIFYDWSGPRLYLPWDLDSTMSDTYDVYTGTVPGGTTVFTDTLFTNWQGDYTTTLSTLLAGPLSLAAIDAEIDRIAALAGPSLEADPFVGGSASAAAAALKSYWASRHPQVAAQVAAH